MILNKFYNTEVIAVIIAIKMIIKEKYTKYIIGIVKVIF